MSFVATWMDLEIVIVSELSQSYPTIWLTCGIWKKNTSELICIRETDSQSLKTNLQSPKGTGGIEECSESLGLAYTHCGIWNDWPMGNFCRAQGTLSNILW